MAGIIPEDVNVNWENFLDGWDLNRGTRRPRSKVPPRPALIWRGPAARKFSKVTPPPGYHIDDRIRDIVSEFPPFLDTDEEDEEDKDEDESEDESEDERLEKKKDQEIKKERKKSMKSELEKRMKETIEYSDSEDERWDESEDEEELLDELQAYVESVDVVKVLDIENLLFPFLRYVLSNKHAARIRAKGAEVVATLVQRYPATKHLVINEKGLHRLLRNFTTDLDATSRTNALVAISSLIRNNEPAITAFRLANGYEALRNALSSESVIFQRRVLSLICYLLHENSSDCNIVTVLGLPSIMMDLASNDDLEVREAALRGLLVLAIDEGGNSGQSVKNDDKLKQVLEARIEGISAMAPEDLRAALGERQLVDSLWNVCYNEPSSLVEKGLLVLPGEDAPAPDVASKLVEPSLKPCAAAEAPLPLRLVSPSAAAEAALLLRIGSPFAAAEAALLLGIGSPFAATPTVEGESRPAKKRKRRSKGKGRNKGGGEETETSNRPKDPNAPQVGTWIPASFTRT